MKPKKVTFGRNVNRTIAVRIEGEQVGEITWAAWDNCPSPFKGYWQFTPSIPGRQPTSNYKLRSLQDKLRTILSKPPYKDTTTPEERASLNEFMDALTGRKA